jgi:hypothetical protein
MITGFRPAASARPWRSCTFSLREAAISTSTSPATWCWADHAEVQAHFVERERDVLVGLGLDLHLELLVGQAAREDDLLGDDGGRRQRHRDVAVRVPLFLMSRRIASATSSNFSTLPSLIQPRSSGSIAQRSRTRVPDLSRPSSTSLTLDELMSKPSKGAGWRLNNDPREIKLGLLPADSGGNKLKVPLEC